MTDGCELSDRRGDVEYFFDLARMADLRCRDLGPKTVATNHLAVALEILASHSGKAAALKQLDSMKRALVDMNADREQPKT